MRLFCVLMTIFLLLGACGKRQENKTSGVAAKPVIMPVFNADTALHDISRQVGFGPRVPGTKAHTDAGDFLIHELKRAGAAVTVQQFEATTFDNHPLKLRNIIATFNPTAQKRILLAAHWDTRPFADKDKEKQDASFDGANDGASGTGILLEIASVIHKTPPSVGVDIIFFDGEDWGEKDREYGKVKVPEGLDSWWCLGSQYWSKHKHKPNYSAYYGILLDMAGAKGAHFFREGISQKYAPKVVDKVWRTASRLGYDAWFVSQDQSGIQDDHVFVNEIANIPMIDIVDYQPGVGYFGDYHHTRKDNMDLISKETVAAVGTVLVNVIYSEE